MKIFIPEKLYGIIGYPLGHSLSPLIHNWGFAHYGLASAYLRWPVEPDALAGLLGAVRALPISGLSVTIPHKSAVMEHLDAVSDLAAKSGAVNTLYWKDGALCGHNTDVEGFLAPLTARRLIPESAMVLGAGGAARAVLVGLGELGVKEIAVCNRDPQKSRALCEEFAVSFVQWEKRSARSARLLVNATPLGMRGAGAELTPWPGERFEEGQIAYDLVYTPKRTRFLREAELKGCTTLGGLEMFIGQACAQFRLWTGLELPYDGARALLEAELNKDLNGSC